MILMNDFKAEPAELRAAMSTAAARVFASGWYVLGTELKAFEQRWAQACGTRHCLGVGNGMDAIELALRALDIGPGAEVVTTPMTAFATVLAILRAGATPVLADIEPDSGLLSPASVRRCLTPRTRAVVLVHLYGQMRDMQAWGDLCRTAGIDLIEDCAQAHLARWDDQVAGSIGSAGAYSFYPTKNLGAIGDGGALVTQSQALAERVGRLRNYGQSERYVHPELGMNSRLDELQAALLSERMKWLDGFTARRRVIAGRYDQGIRNPRVRLLAPPRQPLSHVHHLYVLLCDDRAALAQHLADQGVQTLIHYPVPVHRQAPCAGLARDPLGLPAAESHAAGCLSLPCHPQMTDADIETVVDAVNAFGTGV
ncbi:MAG: DegT/DnrJ/EryC1/StrS family aminotransferase [Burkholderiaceae bacterium]|nr:DegT/DnrJ/EryC1/StrS family aminotransferase [Burkholderiaceae bacterium]